MKTKATISINPDTLFEAKKLARKRKTSVSGLIEILLNDAVSSSSGLVDEMVGSAELDTLQLNDPLYSKLLQKYIHG